MSSPRVVIIGAGLAGASTAWQLSLRGVDQIAILEKEAVIGYHSSGRNAAMIRQLVEDTEIAALAREGGAFLRDLPTDWVRQPQFDHCGSYLLSSGDDLGALHRMVEAAQQAGVPVDLKDRTQVAETLSVLRDADFELAAYSPTDGVVDVAGLLGAYLKEAISGGAQLHVNCRVQHIARKVNEFIVETNQGEFTADVIVNAAGAWAGRVGEMMGSRKLPLRPCRRHLYVTGPMDWVDPKWPFAWDVAHGLYFRPESGGLLLCPCDVVDHPPGSPNTDSGVTDLLAEKLDRHMPGLSHVTIQTFWAGLRTLTPDSRFVIGWDQDVDGLFWVAGLGGHGVTTSAAVGRFAADRLLREDAGENPLGPGRFK
ncbi:FAD-binding oxidoreductase [bacterium]|nr:FAD-binding oxidoreductase [bacterium]